MKILISWSSGKDSAWTRHLLAQKPEVEVVALLTSFNATADRVAMHAVRRSLVEAQARSLRLSLWHVDLPFPCSNVQYEEAMAPLFQRAADEGVEGVAFGDLFLQEIRAYRERQLQGTGLTPIFPLWGLPTDDLARTMIRAGVRATLTCIDPAKLDRTFAGASFDTSLLERLPPSVDPCGENGEFHTFVSEAPGFHEPVQTEPGEIVERDEFVFADLLLKPLPTSGTSPLLNIHE